MKKKVVAKSKPEPPRIYRVGHGTDAYTSPPSTQSWLVQANSVTEALAKAINKLKWLENEEKITIEPLGALTIK